MRLIDRRQRKPSPDFLEGRFATLAFIVVVAAAYLTMFIAASNREGVPFFPWWEITLLILLGVVYCFLNLRPEFLIDAAPGLAGQLLYFGTVYGLAFWIGILGDAQGQIWLLFLPAIGQAAEHSIGMLVVISIVCLAAATAIFYVAYDELNYQIPLFVSPAVIFVAAFSQIAVRERNSRMQIEVLAAKLREANHKLSLYAEKIEELAVIRERNRMAREIHDSLGHYLTVVNVQIGAARAILSQNQERAVDALDKAQRLTQEGLQEVRQSVSMLRESRDLRPLAESLPELIELTRAAGIETTLSIEGDARPLPPRLAQGIYRTVQEALTNIRKHAEAGRAWVALDWSQPEQITLEVRDDGRGADNLEGGFGLLGIQERISLLGGKLAIETAPGAGFSLMATLPSGEEVLDDEP